MKINRIGRIKGHRIFRDFTWSAALPEFARFNLIYGWNGSGKTTLSGLFRSMEKRQSVNEGQVEFFIDGKSCFGASFATNSALPNVRVFNREYVEASVFKPGDEMEPIFVLGEDSVEKQKEIETLRKQADAEKIQLGTAQQAKRNAEKAEDDLCVSKGGFIKDLLGGDAASAYRNYDKRGFRAKAEELLKPDAVLPNSLSDVEREKLNLKQQEKPKEKITSISISLENASLIHTEAKKLLSTTVVARVLQYFVDHPEVATWVESGLPLHKEVGSSCEFCGQSLPMDRLTALEGHFNDQNKALKSALDSLVDRINQDIRTLAQLRTPDKTALYADLSAEYNVARKQLELAAKARKQLLSDITVAITAKKTKAFEPMELQPNPEQEGKNSVETALNELNSIIAKHNKETDEFEKRISTARKTLELHFVADALSDYKSRRQTMDDATAKCLTLTNSIGELDRKISQLDREIAGHLRPAEELNRELRTYLGRDELVLRAEKKGYTITRHGFPADHLSEGEKTAIAFLHFLKSLQSKDFQLSMDIVVVDDPVSSLDSNALFCAFAFLKERTKDAGQLFVLTHNFTFFSLVRKWFGFQKKEARRHYMLETRITSDARASAIVQLDSSLERFHSEYHFLFSRIHAETQNISPPAEIADLYALPNIARRFLETFLAFRRPGLSLDPNKVDLDKKIASVAPGFDSVKKARILRFVQAFSHDNKITDEEHDLFLLGEAREVLRDVLDLVAEEDHHHFNGMLTSIGQAVPVP